MKKFIIFIIILTTAFGAIDYDSASGIGDADTLGGSTADDLKNRTNHTGFYTNFSDDDTLSEKSDKEIVSERAIFTFVTNATNGLGGDGGDVGALLTNGSRPMASNLNFGNNDATNIKGLLVNSNAGIGTANPDASAVLDVTSTTAGFLPPRMSTAQIDAIVSPATGLVAFDTNRDLLRIRKPAEWCYIPCGVVTGQFSHGVSQKPSVTTPVSLLFDMNDITLEGIAHSTNVKSEEFTATLQKSFTFMLAPQWERTTTGVVRAIDFFMQNSTNAGTNFVDVKNSNVKVRVDTDASGVMPLMYTISMNPNDIVRFQMRVETTGDGLGTVFFAAEVGPPTIPATPSQILTIFSGD